MLNRRALLALVPALFVPACSDDDDDGPRNIFTGPTSTNDLIEFRVTGDLLSVTVQITNSIDGFSQAQTVLPYSHTLRLIGRDPVFVSLTARGSGAGFLHVGIFVNGLLFREASSSLFNPFVQVSGTYRRPTE